MTGAEFREARAKLALTQSAMADRIGVTRRAVQYYESGQRQIPQPVQKLIAIIGESDGKRQPQT